MGHDCIPKDDAERVDWLSNYKDKIALFSESLGLNLDETAAIREEVGVLLVAYEKLAELRQSLHGAVNLLRKQERGLMEKLRVQIAEMKTGAKYSSEIGQQLRIEGKISFFEPGAFKPTFNLMAEAGCVRVDFEKGETDAVNIYSRTRGQAAWRFVARDTNSPYMDCSAAVSTNGSVEIREYMLRGVLNGEEVGRTSDVANVSCGESARGISSVPAKRVGRWA